MPIYQTLNDCDTNLESCIENLDHLENLFHDNISDDESDDEEKIGGKL